MCGQRAEGPGLVKVPLMNKLHTIQCLWPYLCVFSSLSVTVVYALSTAHTFTQHIDGQIGLIDQHSIASEC
jgi:hypothetical protein